MTYGSSALKNRDEKATDNFELKNWFAVLKNKEEMQTETNQDTIGETI